MKSDIPSKSVALVFRGFDASPDLVEALLQAKASDKGVRGLPVRNGAKALFKRSFARFSVDLDRRMRLDEVVPALLSSLGGIEKLLAARDSICPELFELSIVWPIKGSLDQEGGFIPISVISDLERLKCTLSFSFL